MINYVVFLLCCACISASARVDLNVDSLCQTPSNAMGICLRIKDCPSLKPLWSNRHSLPASNIQFLLDSQCGSLKRMPLLCCKTEIPIRLAPLDVNTQLSLLATNTTDAPDTKDAPDTASDPDTTNAFETTGHPNLPLINPKYCGISSVGMRIINGNKTQLNEYPWMALLQYRTKKGLTFGCGGTLINTRYILTAAHCIRNSTESKLVSVRLGEYDVTTEEDCEGQDEDQICAPPVQDIEVESVVMYRGYTTQRKVDDIALIRLAQPADVSQENVQPICLPDGDELSENLDDMKMLVAGWGATETGRASSVLMKVLLPVVSNEECNATFSRFNTRVIADQMCAGGSNLGQDSCKGDSGGPLKRNVDFNGIASMIQYGIVSFGSRQCGTVGLPGVYTRVSRYIPWILDNLQPF